MGDTPIEWTDKTWSPLRVRVRQDASQIARDKNYTSLIQIAEKMAGSVGPHCEPVSHGCDNCYSCTNNARRLTQNGTGLPFDRRSRDLVEPFVDEKILLQPLGWRKPNKIFVANQTDLFGDWWTDEQIDRVFAVMALCPQHTFQVLTKRPERMLAYFHSFSQPSAMQRGWNCAEWMMCAMKFTSDQIDTVTYSQIDKGLPNVWLGVSCEDQATADARIPILLQTPAAKRFVSYEPALEPVEFDIDWLFAKCPECQTLVKSGWHDCPQGGCDGKPRKRLDWGIVGGESGAGARPCEVETVWHTARQFAAAGVPLFVKQLGAIPIVNAARSRHWEWGMAIGRPDPKFTAVDKLHPSTGPWRIHLKKRSKDGIGWTADRKGGDMTAWPKHLRVREFPA